MSRRKKREFIKMTATAAGENQVVQPPVMLFAVFYYAVLHQRDGLINMFIII